MPRSKTKRCPICGKPAEQDSKPFCSKRCLDADLGNWLTGKYTVPVVESEESMDEEEPSPTQH